MSSEMRELIAKWRDEAANPDSHIPAAGLLHCADALEAILGDDDEEECPHTMRYQDGDGSVMCCDCGALIAPVANALLEYRGALKACLKAMDVARDTIQPITTAQIRLHNLNPQTDKLLDAAADKAIALLARTEAGADGAIGEVIESDAVGRAIRLPRGWAVTLDALPVGTKIYAGSPPSGGEYMAMHWIDRYAAGIDDEPQIDLIRDALTSPAHTSEARDAEIARLCAQLAEMEHGFRDMASKWSHDAAEMTHGIAATAVRSCVDEVFEFLGPDYDAAMRQEAE